MAWAATIYPPRITPRVVGHCLQALAAIDLDWLRRRAARGRRTPTLYESGVRYIEEPPGEERWLSIPWVLREGGGDCEDLACWRVAELRLHGEQAFCEPRFKRHARGWLVHILVRRADGTTEDPSKLLGMKGDDSWLYR